MHRSFGRLAPLTRPFSINGVFVINLDRRPDRWAAISHVCKRAGLPSDVTQRVSAVDGTSLDVEACHRCGFVSKLGMLRLQEPAAHHIWGMDLNRGALGCALSHVQLWSRIASLSSALTPTTASSFTPMPSQKGCYLILEDDAELISAAGDSACSFLEELQSRMDGVPLDWELVYVGGLDTAGQCAATLVADGVSRVPQYHRTTTAYLLTPQGARRLLATCVPLTFQLDTMMTMKVGLPSGQPTVHGAVPYVLDPVSYTLQPPLMKQAAHLGTDIQESKQKEKGGMRKRVDASPRSTEA
jgi:GR25 family glycosyltransferase involved in LPS biosynthesis